eukprot:4467203-Pleurochrysis_carterae.AAC.1
MSRARASRAAKIEERLDTVSSPAVKKQRMQAACHHAPKLQFSDDCRKAICCVLLRCDYEKIQGGLEG